LESNPIERNYMNTNQAAAYLGMHINTLYLHKEIPVIRMGTKRIYRKETLDKFMAGLERSEGNDAGNN